MKTVHLFGLFIGLLAAACSGPALADGKTLQQLESDIAAFVGEARAPLTEGSEPVRVAERLMTGFQQDPIRRTELEGVGTVYWGWQEGQAFVQSVAVYDCAGALKLLGAVDNLPRLYNPRTKRAVSNVAQYQALLSKQASWGSYPSLALFVQGPADLKAQLPMLKRWSQAAMMGYSVDCADTRATAGCAFAQQVTLPTLAFDAHCLQQDDAERCRMSVPDTSVLAVPLDRFVQ